MSNKKKRIVIKIIGYGFWVAACMWLGHKIFWGVCFMMLGGALLDWARALKRLED